jgi:galacturonosyltransferase
LKLLKKIKPDVVFTYTIKPNVYGGMACALKRIPYIANVTGLGTAVQNGGIMQKLTLTLYKLGLKKAKMVFFQNSENQKFMLKCGIVKGNNDLLPGSGVNLEQHCFEPYPESDEKVVLLTIGRMMRDKGTNEILQAAKIIKADYSNVVFRFIGAHDGNCKENLDIAVKQGIVEYIGKQPGVHPFIKESHATLHASYHEGMSNVLLETASSGRPVIATDVPGCRETYDDGVSGIAFKPKDVDDLVRAIKEFLSLTNEQKAQMGKAGREKMENEFNRNIIISKYLNIIENL